MPTFDVVSEVDAHELQNAVDQVQKEIANRFDFKGTSASVESKDGALVIMADSDFQAQQIHPIVYQRLGMRGIDIACLEAGAVEKSGKGVRQVIKVREGIDRELAKKLVAAIKDAKLKVQAQVQGEQLRVSGKKRDDLQAAITVLKGVDAGMPLQYQNFRD